MNALTGLGKYLFAIPFLIFGVMHFMNGNQMAGMVPIPGGAIWVYITGLALVLAALSILIGKMDKLATILLGIMLLIFALSMHLPGVINAGEDQMAMQMSMTALLKDMALGGASWVYAKFAATDDAVVG